MTYGLELLNLSRSDINHLEDAHVTMAKKVQGLSMTSPNTCALAPLGWRSITATVMVRSLTMLWQILLLPMNSPYKRIVVSRMLHHHHHQHIMLRSGPVWNMYKHLEELTLVQDVTHSITNGTYMSLYQWKLLVKSRVSQIERNKWVASCGLFRSLILYRQVIVNIIMWPWWQYALI